MYYWFLLTQNCVFPADERKMPCFDAIKKVIVVTSEDTMPSKILKESKWIGTNENDNGDTKVTMLSGWSQLDEDSFNHIKSRVDVIWYVAEDKWEWPCMERDDEMLLPPSQFQNPYYEQAAPASAPPPKSLEGIRLTTSKPSFTQNDMWQVDPSQIYSYASNKRYMGSSKMPRNSNIGPDDYLKELREMDEEGV